MDMLIEQWELPEMSTSHSDTATDSLPDRTYNENLTKPTSFCLIYKTMYEMYDLKTNQTFARRTILN